MFVNGTAHTAVKMAAPWDAEIVKKDENNQ